MTGPPVRYLYLLHTCDVRCGYCDGLVVDASQARPHLRVAVGAHQRPIRLPALDAIPLPFLLAVRCDCGRDVFYGAPVDAVPLLSDQPPGPSAACATYVLAGA
jgi:hypothetical protein